MNLISVIHNGTNEVYDLDQKRDIYNGASYIQVPVMVFSGSLNSAQSFLSNIQSSVTYEQSQINLYQSIIGAINTLPGSIK